MARVDALAAQPTDRAGMIRQFDRIAPPHPSSAPIGTEPHMTVVDLECDVFIAGGGMAGVCAALAAARHGAKVVLAQDRSRLGGNASSEVKMHIVGADIHGGRPGWREGGIIEELRLEDAVQNPHRSWELWDLLLYDKIKSEPNILLLLDSALYRAEVSDKRITTAWVRCDKSEHLYRIKPAICLDCTGDGRLALEAGAEFRMGREAKSEFNEPLAYETEDRHTMGSSILFTARDFGRPISFKAPSWARKVTKDQLRFRGISSWEYGYWWIEWGGQINSIRDHEQIRFELLSIVLGIWDYIKNSGEHPSSANWGMDWVGMFPGKRESRRIMGDYLMTQADITGERAPFDDAVAIGGWPLDDHPPMGFDVPDQPPFRSIKGADVYNIPLRALCSRSVANLMMAGRNISVTHAALSSTRVMATCAALGQAAGSAAAQCAQKGIPPGALYQDKALLKTFQQQLLRDDQTIKGLRNEDPADLARKAQVSASSHFADALPEHIINGAVRDMPGQWANRWAAEMTPEGPWIELAWDKPQTIRQIQITHDTGFHRELTLSSSDSANARVVRGPQPETIRDYEITYTDASGKTGVPLVKVSDNHQRLNRHVFEAIEVRALRIHVTATHGEKTARLYEVRCYA